jgi:glycosyltransferase involved in cell wall biosynthesis
MTDPLVSVKMITYNHAAFITQAIECVLKQKTNFPFELVIGEDCSTDGTRDIVFDYQKKYPNIIRVITSEKNVGMKKNAYRAVKACRGKYVAFCEGDDYWHNPEKLQKQVDYLESHPECGAVHSSFDVHHIGSGHLIKDYIRFKNWAVPRKMDIYNLLNDCGIGFWIHTCTAMIRRHLYEQITEADPYIHQSDQFLMGDTPLWAEASLLSEIVFLPESLATYRMLEESASNSKDIIKKCRFNKSNADVKLYICDKHRLPEEYRRIIEAAWCYHTLRLAFYERNANLATEIRKRKNMFTWQDWLRYYGARNSACYYLCRAVAYFSNLIRKNSEII